MMPWLALESACMITLLWTATEESLLTSQLIADNLIKDVVRL